MRLWNHGQYRHTCYFEMILLNMSVPLILCLPPPLDNQSKHAVFPGSNPSQAHVAMGDEQLGLP